MSEATEAAKARAAQRRSNARMDAANPHAFTSSAPSEDREIDFSGTIVVPADHDLNSTGEDIVVTRSIVTVSDGVHVVPPNTGNDGFVPRNTGDTRRAAARTAAAGSVDDR